MKSKAFSLFIGLFLFTCAFSQYTKFIDVDTLKGADTITFTTEKLKLPNGFVAVEAWCDQITGSSTSDYMVLQASQSGDVNGFATLNTVDYVVYAAQNDTVQIVDSAVGLWGVSGLPFDYFQIKAFGVSGDTTIIHASYVAKRY